MKKIIGLGLAVVLGLGMVVMTGCDKNKAQEETAATAPTTTTEATTTTEPTTKKVTYKTLYREKLEALIDEYHGVNGGKLVDMDEDGTPEMIVFSGVAPKFEMQIFTIDDKKVVEMYDRTFSGLRYWQSDVSYEAWINESISPTTVTVFDSSDEWTEDKAYAVSMPGGAISLETLQAKAKGEPDDPDWSRCKCTINEGSVSASEYEAERDRLETGADVVNPAANHQDSLLEALSE